MDSLLLVQSKQAPINTDECVVTLLSVQLLWVMMAVTDTRLKNYINVFAVGTAGFKYLES